MSTVDEIYAAFAPSDKLKDLSTFAPNVLKTRSLFTNLFALPHLESMSVGSQSGSEPNGNLLELVDDGIGRFSHLILITVQLAANVNSYELTFHEFVDSVTIDTMVATMKLLAQSFADLAKSSFKDNKTFFEKFSNYIAGVNSHIDNMNDQLELLGGQIEEKSEDLGDKTIVSVLENAFKEVYTLLSDEEDIAVQLVALLDLVITDLSGDFNTLFADSSRTEQVTKSLNAQKGQVATLKDKLTQLSSGLNTVITQSNDFLTFWVDVAQSMTATGTDKIDSDVANKIETAWKEVQSNAEKYIEGVSGSPSAPVITMGKVKVLKALPRMPGTKAQVEIAKLVMNIPLYKAQESFLEDSEEEPDEETIKRFLGVPDSVQTQLNDLGDSIRQTVLQLNALINLPFTDQILGPDPTDPSGEKKTTIKNMLSYYRGEYLTLYYDTATVAANIRSYAKAYIDGLPGAVAGLDSMRIFLKSMGEEASECNRRINMLFLRATGMTVDWKKAVNVLKKAIDEFETHLEQEGEDNADIKANFKQLLVALIAVAAPVAFVSPMGAAFAIGLGISYITLQITGNVEKNEFTKLKTGFKKIKEKAREIEEKLIQELDPVLEAAGNSFNRSLETWKKITQIGQDEKRLVQIFQLGDGRELVRKLLPDIIEGWKSVRKSCEEFIDTVHSE